MEKNRGHNTSEPAGVVIKDLAQEYLQSLRLRQYSPKSVATYGNVLTAFLEFAKTQGRARVADVTREDLETWRLVLVQRNFAPASLEVYLRTVRQFFAWLESRQLLFLNPAAGLVIPKPPRKLLPVPSEEAMTKLLSQPNVATSCGLRDRALLETGYSTGARREELERLTIFDADLDHGTLRVLGKGKKERVVPLGKQAVLWLTRYLREARPKLLKGHLDETALWIDLHGHALDYSAFQQILKRHSQAAGLEPSITPHALRRACVTHMLKRGAHPLELQLLLGHATLRTLSQYLRLTITELQEMHRKSKPGS